MAGERTIPILPCPDIDAMLDFYAILGFEKTYRQTRPNPYIAVRRDDMHLQFFGLDGFEPAESYGSCIVAVADADALYRSITDGLRAAFGKVPRSGIPRVTRPRTKADAVYGFSVVDPGGNWIRVTQPPGEPSEQASTTGLARALANAVTLGEARGDAASAARLLDNALVRFDAAPSGERLRALVYRVELAIAMDDLERGRDALARIAKIDLDASDRVELTSELERIAELEIEVL